MQLQAPFLAVTPTVDGDVLDVLCRADAPFTLPAIHRLVPQRSYMGLQNAAERLAEQGIVVRTRVGRTRTYTLNREHLLAEAVLAIHGAKSRLIERLRRECAALPLTFAALFGSGARGDMSTDSDIDLLFVRDDSASGSSDDVLYDLAASVERMTGNQVSPLIYSDVDLPFAEPLFAAVAREGIVLAGDPRWLTTSIRRAG